VFDKKNNTADNQVITAVFVTPERTIFQ